VSHFDQAGFESAVERIKEYIVAGDVMQVVISQRMSVEFGGDPLNVYRALRYLNPSPYMVFFDLGDHHVVSASPEILARVEQGKITVRPLAGTRKRGANETEDLALEQDLLSDAKEIAEHLMLIDLSRNDSGRVSKVGSITVPKQMFVERYSHVMHIASIVESEMSEDKTALDVLKSTLPVGTLSGAPKVRAMEIIDEMEPERRGIYGGAMGYLAWNGNMDMAIAIRTAVIKDSRLYVQAGAGVVADSVPRLEWEETLNKARAIVRAVQLADEQLELG
jgi:anthranilate synthase component 1